MPVLWTPTFNPSGQLTLPRAYLWGFAIGWVDHTVIQAGRETICVEHTFGGYEFHITWKANFWNWNSNGYTMDYPFEAVYVVEPIGHTIIPAGAVVVISEVTNPYFVPAIVLTLAGSDGHYSLQQFPSGPAGWWSQGFYPTPPSPFYAH